ncbi:hypothetical protein CBF27_05975 [Vagococcus acidifermentans]|uniref:Uncharacterized protein n=1 Tax=Vagococcus acidifermentans TaxID=564710 RepID=A0A430AWT8_9ENTE|nr:hypothetical protein CBF27_05975 [Vagococcus acidifermentans]
MARNKNLYLKGAIQIMVFILVMILLSSYANFSLTNFLIGTMIFSLGVGINIYLKRNGSEK